MSNPITVRNPLANNRPVDVAAILAAISDFADIDRDAVAENAARFSCTEVDSIATTLATAGHYESAADWIEAHSEKDEEGDEEGHLHVQSMIGDGGLGDQEGQHAAHGYVQTLVEHVEAPADNTNDLIRAALADAIAYRVGESGDCDEPLDVAYAKAYEAVLDAMGGEPTHPVVADPEDEVEVLDVGGFRIGDRVVSTDYGYSGEVTALHAICPMGAAQQMSQSVPLDTAAIAAPWVSVRPDTGGSAWVPTTRLRHEDADDRARLAAATA